jgi:hypothetical protein
MRRLLLSLALAASLSALSASSALAQAPELAQKAPLYGPEAATAFSCEAGVFPTPKKFGFVVLDTPGNEGTVSGEIALKRAAPNTEYVGIFVDQSTGSLCTPSPIATSITTNKKGNGNLHFSVERVPSATKFWVGMTSASSSETIGSSSVELD